VTNGYLSRTNATDHNVALATDIAWLTHLRISRGRAPHLARLPHAVGWMRWLGRSQRLSTAMAGYTAT